MKLAVFLVCYVLYIVQLHAQSTVDWVQTLGGSGEDRSEKIAVDGASNVYSIGYFRDTIGNLHSFGGADVLLTKHNADGQLLWMKQFGSIDEDKGNDIAIDKHGNIYICGEYRNGPLFYTGDSLNSAGTFDGFVAKLDTAGTILWIEAIQSAANELATAIACDTSGNVYVGGVRYCRSASHSQTSNESPFEAANLYTNTQRHNDQYQQPQESEPSYVSKTSSAMSWLQPC